MTHAVRDTDTLPTAPLGTTGMRITRVGFGAWAIGGGGWTFAWGNQDDAACAMDNASRAPACKALALNTSHAARPSGVPDENPRAAAR